MSKSTPLSLFLSLSLFLLLPRASAQVECDSLGVSVAVASCSPSLPPPNNGVSVVQANSTFACKVILSFNFTQQYHNVDFANFGVGYGSITSSQLWSYGSYFPRGLYFDAGFDGTRGPANTSSYTIYGNFTVTPNAVGAYYGGWSMTLMQFNSEPFIYCNYNGALGASSALPSNLLILNDLYTSDITPPYVFSIKVEYPKYRVGDIVRTFAYIVDRSDLFLDDAWTSYSFNRSHSVECPSATWRQLTNTEQEKFGLQSPNRGAAQMPRHSVASPFHPASPQLASSGSATDGWFMTECEVTKDVVPGLYNLTLLNMFDIWFNGLDGAPFWTESVYFRID